MNRRTAISLLAATLLIQDGTAGDAPKTLLVLGDSLTKGYGVLESEAYPALLGKLAGEGWRVVNGGGSGDTTAGGLRRLGWLLKTKPDLLVIALGGNDGLRGIDPATTEMNLGDIIDRTRTANPEVKSLLAGIKVRENMGADFVTRFDRVFPKVAKDKAVPLLPNLLEGVGGVDALNQPDRIHPNPKGHKKLAETVWGKLVPLLAD